MEYDLPLISVIVPNYNHEKYLEQRLKSIFNQTYSNFEVILLDDYSTDNSRILLSEYAKNSKVSHCVFNTENTGNTFTQWNTGIVLATGDFIWIAESDDFCELNFLEELVKPLLFDQGITLVYCQSNKVNELSEITGNWITHTDDLNKNLFLGSFTLDGNEFIERFLIYKNVIPNASGVVFRRAIVTKLGKLDDELVLKTCGDWLFYLKLITNNKITYIDKSLNYFRYHSESVIAGAVKTESVFSIIDIELKMREKMVAFLLAEKPYNYNNIVKVNTQIKKIFIYNRALFLFRNDKKLKSLLIASTIPILFFKKYKIKMKVKMKMEKFFKSIYKK